MQKARRRPKASTACRHTVSGSFSLPFSGFFSPFLHSTSSLSVFEEYLALPDGSGRFRQDFTCPALLRILLSYKQLSCTGLSPISPDFPICSTNSLHKCRSPTTPYQPKLTWFGLVPVRSPLLRKSLLFSFPAPTQMFQFSAFAHLRVYSLQLYGFPHSEMSGSQDICSSPNLIAAYHVLLRLSEPRHPPCALSNLLISIYSSLILLLQSIPICQRTLLL